MDSVKMAGIYQNFKRKSIKVVGIFSVAMMFVVVGMGSVAYADGGDVTSELKEGYDYLSNNQADMAIEVFSKIIEVDPKNCSALYGRGNSYLTKEMNDKAIENFDVVAKLDPKMPWTYAYRGVAYLNKGMKKNAVADFNTFLKYVKPNDPKFPPFKKFLATLGFVINVTTVNPDIGNATMNQLLLKGIDTNDLDMVKSAVANGANVNIYDSGCQTGTALIRSLGKDEIMNYLINAGADVNTEVYMNGWPGRKTTAFNGAICRRDLSAVQNMVDNGANVNYRDSMGYRPLDYAISTESIPIIKYLLEHGAVVNYNWVSNYFDGRTPLMTAVGEKGNIQIVQILIDAGADIKRVDARGQTVLDYAIRNGNKELINLFMPSN
ncbi:MAG: nlpI 2 [Firmicutes bacterium]|nr:nlpI 2 [Bacillota bacterium]